MKVLPFKIPKTAEDTLIIQEDRNWILYDQFHQHEEMQISMIIEGKGTVLVGDTFIEFKKNDIIIFGSNIPHVWRSIRTKKESYMISLYFTKESFGDTFFELPEFEGLHSFFQNAQYGIKMLSKKKKLRKLFTEISKTNNRLIRFTIFMRILHAIREARSQPISSFLSKKIYSDHEGKRMASVLESVMNNFNKEFSLKDAADLASMTPNAFCRYFKQRTNKTFFQFLIEVRIENACRLLASKKEITISEASFSSGFKNLSNFNRKFKEIKGVTPSHYKKKLYNPHFT